MKDYKIILAKIVELENQLQEKRHNEKIGRGQNLDMVNEPLFNQAQALRWALDISVNEDIDELDIELSAGNYK
jgi:hypothetical protein